MILLLKVTLLLGAGWLTAVLFSRRPAAVRHLIWVLTLSGAVALPLLTPLAPAVRIPLLTLPALSVGGTGSVPAKNLPAGRVIERGGIAAALPGERPVTRPISRATPRTSFRLDTGQALLAAWLLGALIVALWYALGHARLALLLRRATPVSEPEWRALLQELSLQSGVTAPVRLFRSAAVGSPVTWGLRRPVVLLPADAETWPSERRRIVLAHELAHAARGDYAAQLIACLASAVYWFHPLAWVAARRLRVESERACDDHVVSRGTPGFEYAAHLLDVARQSRVLRLGGMVSIGMARPSHFEGRLLAVLDERQPRQAPRPRARRAAWVGLAALVLPLAALKPAARAADAAGLDEHPPGLPVTAPAEASVAPPAADKPPIRQEPDSVIERSIPATPGGVLELDLESGGTVDLQGWDEPTVRVRGRLAGSSWRDTRVSVERSGNGVTVHSWQETRRTSSSTSHKFEIRVPRRYDVRISSAGGDVTIVDVEGSFNGETGGGEIVIERAHGQAHLSTGGGEIRVADSDLGGSISTGGGLVTLSRVRGGLKGHSGSGPVIYAGGEGVTGNLKNLTIDREGIHVGKSETRADDIGMLHIQKAGGAIILEGAPSGAELSTGGGEIRVGPSKGFIGASTGGGDVDIGPVAGSVKAGTGAGSVHIWITDAKGAERLIDVTSGSGAVVLELPPDLGARFELETAYTKGFGRRTSIQSDWSLEQEETSEWDDTQGSPRKYVRAYGRVGGGGGLIRVRTVNGNITVRRRQP